jgi:hypothetical protein
MSAITVRIPQKVKEKLKKYNVDVSETVRKALNQRLEELERKDLEEKLDQIKEQTGSKIDAKSLVKLLREERETR